MARTIDPYTRKLAALKRSRFRSKFRLAEKERRYAAEKGLETIRDHAFDFVTARIGTAQPQKDGKQTPMRGHPVFVAQHATATCCRGCLQKWHGIAKGSPLSIDQIEYVVTLIMRWIEAQL